MEKIYFEGLSLNFKGFSEQFIFEKLFPTQIPESKLPEQTLKDF